MTANTSPKIHPPLAAALARGKIARKTMAAAEGGSITCQAAAKLLGISEASVVLRWRAYRIIGWKAGKALRIPVWQFHEGKLLKGMEEILQIFHSDDQWRIVRYFLGNRRSLANERPLDLLRRGKSATVIKHATDYSQDNEW
jgi:hypothetical protein